MGRSAVPPETGSRLNASLSLDPAAARRNAQSSAMANIDAQQEFHIPSQPLETALLQYSRQSGLQVISSAPVVANKVAPALNGRTSPLMSSARTATPSGLPRDENKVSQPSTDG